MKLERIMVPTDLSPGSFAAVKYAIDMASEHEAEVVLVHVVEQLPRGIGRRYKPTKLLEQYAETAKDDLDRLGKEATQLYPKCRTELHFGVVHDVITALVTKLKVDLVVMSMRRHVHPLNHLISGVGEKILRHVPCSVLRIRQPVEAKAGKVSKSAVEAS